MDLVFEPWMAWAALAIFALILMSGFFSGSETALTATSKARMLSFGKEKEREAARVLQLVADRESLIGAILLGNNMVNILASSIAAAVFLALFGEAGVPIATLVMTALILIFAEVLPKTYALSNPRAHGARGLAAAERVRAPVLSGGRLRAGAGALRSAPGRRERGGFALFRA